MQFAFSQPARLQKGDPDGSLDVMEDQQRLQFVQADTSEQDLGIVSFIQIPIPLDQYREASV